MRMPSAKVTEAEVDDIEAAIDHPPSKADHFGMLASVVSAVYTIARTKSASIDHGGPIDSWVIGSAFAIGLIQIVRYVLAIFEKKTKVLKRLAKTHIRRIREHAGWSIPPPTGWQRIKTAGVDRIVHILSPKK